MKYTDDHNIPCDEMRVLPYSSDGNILVSRASYIKEMRFRREQNSKGIPFDLPSWESLKVYNPE